MSDKEKLNSEDIIASLKNDLAKNRIARRSKSYAKEFDKEIDAVPAIFRILDERYYALALYTTLYTTQIDISKFWDSYKIIEENMKKDGPDRQKTRGRVHEMARIVETIKTGEKPHIPLARDINQQVNKLSTLLGNLMAYFSAGQDFRSEIKDKKLFEKFNKAVHLVNCHWIHLVDYHTLARNLEKPASKCSDKIQDFDKRYQIRPGSETQLEFFDRITRLESTLLKIEEDERINFIMSGKTAEIKNSIKQEKMISTSRRRDIGGKI